MRPSDCSASLFFMRPLRSVNKRRTGTGSAIRHSPSPRNRQNNFPPPFFLPLVFTVRRDLRHGGRAERVATIRKRAGALRTGIHRDSRERERLRLNRYRALDFWRSIIFSEKPASTFPDHALDSRSVRAV